MEIEDNQPPAASRPGTPTGNPHPDGESRSPRRRSGRARSGSRETREGSSAPGGTTATMRGERSSGERRSEGRREGGRREGGRSGGRSKPEGNRGDSPKPEAKPAAASTPAPEKSASTTPLDDLGGDLLASVSRSFSLTIRLLPDPLCEPISLGYLLARTTDTIADTAPVAPAVRLEHLRALLEMIKYGPDPELLRPLQRDLTSRQTHDGERNLIQQLDRVLAWLEAQEPDDRWDLRRTLARIGHGQELDVLRFGEGTADAPIPLATLADLDDYTYFVAGCVGEFWTRLCERHLPTGWRKKDEDEMLALGKRFGQGLQTVNILRDLSEDLSSGRCYLPADLLAKHGLSVSDLRHAPAKARPLIDELRQTALEHLDAGWEYVKALGPYKLRYACALPVLIGLETLGLLAKTSPLEADERLKVSRSSVRGLMASAAVGMALSPWLNRLHGKLRKRAGDVFQA